MNDLSRCKHSKGNEQIAIYVITFDKKVDRRRIVSGVEWFFAYVLNIKIEFIIAR